MKQSRPYRERSLNGRRLSPETLMMSYGYDPALSEHAVKPPLFQSSTFVFESAEAGKRFFELAYGRCEQGEGDDPGLIYSRINNPDLEILEDRLALWEDAADGLVFSSGMAATTTALLSFTKPGDVILHSTPLYGGTEYLLRNILPEFDISHVGFLAGADTDALDNALLKAKRMGRIAAIYIETPANPTNRLVDIERCAWVRNKIAETQETPPVLIVDNTFLGPVWQQPLKFGADLVVYSLTKYVGGHSDVVAGCCLGSDKLIPRVRGYRTILGTMLDPHSCWLLMRSLETLKLRMTESNANAEKIASFLAQHPKVSHVHYLGHLNGTSADRRLYERQCTAPGSTFAFELRGSEAEAFAFLDSLKLIKLAVSLGGTESLAEHPASMTHSDLSFEDQILLGITPAMVRLSIGIENPDDLIADLDQALSAISS